MSERKQVAGGAPQPDTSNGGGKAQSFDPTFNVTSLIQAEARRQDDLREAAAELSTRLAEAEKRRINEQLELREKFTEKLNIAETKRIDAIRAVDVNAVSVANERATAQAAVLASQLTASAEALRTLVSTTATTFAQTLQTTVGQLTDRIGTLERLGYEGQGKQTVADPIYQTLLAEMREMKQSVSEHKGSQAESGLSMQRMAIIISTIIGGALVFSTLIGAAAAFWHYK